MLWDGKKKEGINCSSRAARAGEHLLGKAAHMRSCRNYSANSVWVIVRRQHGCKVLLSKHLWFPANYWGTKTLCKNMTLNFLLIYNHILNITKHLFTLALENSLRGREQDSKLPIWHLENSREGRKGQEGPAGAWSMLTITKLFHRDTEELSKPLCIKEVWISRLNPESSRFKSVDLTLLKLWWWILSEPWFNNPSRIQTRIKKERSIYFCSIWFLA